MSLVFVRLNDHGRLKRASSNELFPITTLRPSQDYRMSYVVIVPAQPTMTVIHPMTKE